MSLSEIEAKGDEVLRLLTEMADAIKPMIPEEFVRESPMLAAYNLIGGTRTSVRVGIGFVRQAVKEAKGE